MAPLLVTRPLWSELVFEVARGGERSSKPFRVWLLGNHEGFERGGVNSTFVFVCTLKVGLCVERSSKGCGVLNGSLVGNSTFTVRVGV
ncbi:hypothetical protein CFELI_11590 [Corynebacterium felinum]|uniref:Uncharacterized protein n=1 Tax=Corynebacterium felinum TaxID=131318 RepID=A0ABU2B532_9CORY|nr:hypothetical protein [Corynebacterium felinum]WJY95901.1 hypothetical protein CFELI_11590 [Corynebacterium felinum]